MAKGNGPVERVKLKRADGEELPYTRFNGERASAARISIAAIFERDGKRNLAFEPDAEAAIRKAYGIPADVKLWVDIYPADDGPKGKSGGGKAPAKGNDW